MNGLFLIVNYKKRLGTLAWNKPDHVGYRCKRQAALLAAAATPSRSECLRQKKAFAHQLRSRNRFWAATYRWLFMDCVWGNGPLATFQIDRVLPVEGESLA